LAGKWIAGPPYLPAIFIGQALPEIIFHTLSYNAIACSMASNPALSVLPIAGPQN